MITRRLSLRRRTTKRHSSAFFVFVILACSCTPKTESETKADTTATAPVQATVPQRDTVAEAAERARQEAIRLEKEEALKIVDIELPLRAGTFAQYPGGNLDPNMLLIAPPIGTRYGLFKSREYSGEPDKIIAWPFFTETEEPVSNEDNPDCNSRSWWRVTYDGSTGWVLPDLEGAYKVLELNVADRAFEFPNVGKVRVGLTGYYDISYSEGEGTSCKGTQMVVLYDSKNVYFIECLENSNVYEASSASGYEAVSRYADILVNYSFNGIGDRLHVMGATGVEGIEMEEGGMLVYFNLSSGGSLHFMIRWAGDHFVADTFSDQ